MFVKSLTIFIIVGLVAGLAFGIYLIDVKHSDHLVFVQGPSLSIVTEKSDYKKGESIKIRIVNTGTEQLKFPDDTYGYRITGLSGVSIYQPMSTYAESYLKPRQEVVFVWEQYTSDGDPALEGIYKIHSKGYDTLNQNIEDSTTVTIWK